MDALRALAREKGIDEYDMLDKLENNPGGHLPADSRSREPTSA